MPRAAGPDCAPSIRLPVDEPPPAPPDVRTWWVSPYREWREPANLLDVDRAWIDAHMALAGRRRHLFAERVAAVCAIMASTGIRLGPLDDDETVRSLDTI
jgi:hypothetical protein